MSDQVSEVAAGSSPLTRGKRAHFAIAAQGCRLIPAHAGKTMYLVVTTEGPTAHPRSRGENSTPTRTMQLRSGSSPLTRGKLRIGTVSWIGPRLIPAHAGKTPRRRGVHRVRPAHPRSRGENTGSAGGCLIVTGSSPLTRGKPCGLESRDVPVRLIPAHAGKTLCSPRPSRTRSAHPRSRGENPADDEWLMGWCGSSPLTRGKRCMVLPTRRPVRLIPAHAGKTTRGHGGRYRRAAHPRSRGENYPACST